MRRPLLLTPGDPAGIGPEVALGALARRRSERPVVLVGSRAGVQAAPRGAGAPELAWHPALSGAIAAATSERGGVTHGFDPGDLAEPVEIAAVRAAVDACSTADAAGLVTGPIHKARLAARGFRHPGHTELLGELCGVERPVMAFVGGELRVALVTVHLPLAAVAGAITQGRVEHVIRTAAAALQRWLRIAEPRLLVCGLNPHAGDSGLLGTEEIDAIEPAIRACRADGLRAVGPVSAEAAFRVARGGVADLVVAMYHDQGLAPLKLVDFGRSVNWTLGLPILRVSVDHGTADDIAGRGVADPTSMIAALELADELAARA
jgi:4-hydroxythreonine-4-phosphate dehydrogenase